MVRYIILNSNVKCPQRSCPDPKVKSYIIISFPTIQRISPSLSTFWFLSPLACHSQSDPIRHPHFHTGTCSSSLSNTAPFTSFMCMFSLCKVNQYYPHQNIAFLSNKTLCTVDGLGALISTLTLQAVGVQQVLTLLMTLDSTLTAAHALTRNAPQQTLTLRAVGGSCCCPDFKMMWCRGWYGIDQRLQSLPQHLQLLQRGWKWWLYLNNNFSPWISNELLSPEISSSSCQPRSIKSRPRSYISRTRIHEFTGRFLTHKPGTLSQIHFKDQNLVSEELQKKRENI